MNANTGFDVHYITPCGDRGVVFRDMDVAVEAAESVEKSFAAQGFSATITDVVQTAHTADRVTYMVIGSYCYGHGDTLAEAKRNLQAQGARLSDGYLEVQFPQGISYRGPSGLGGYRWEVIDSEAADVVPIRIEHPAKRKSR